MTKKEIMNAFLGEDTEFEGELKFHGTIRIDGHFKGDISAVGTLVIGEAGLVEANIHVSSIVLSGELHGNVLADDRVEIHAPGKVFGDIQAPIVVIHEGVLFEGNCRTLQGKDADESQLTVISSNKQD
ncbi:MAG: polymer-forming cytoskeletal protein [Deltaproteobacteria bacterium]|jgi:cytoskeletal protein CcmA (bactofilin family)|nr:polymer-forming cytoskeletal protein [Deltaproteobacteria bacterium]MBW1738172.1 polymer-forming cytoskeletal protein [Deltaproteobacteria bacterium]MBW1908982.1 polymer-forming cytoskeletal protein [Deltaproteobacteria bacterium]MBW2033472.1 polymer-forming cytoskeletal protein [Deltaproteobacteria bacterium]MBW2115465.1 polymer-forming cytoskeletal protein [Deltaproteobacteria bacterium]